MLVGIFPRGLYTGQKQAEAGEAHGGSLFQKIIVHPGGELMAAAAIQPKASGPWGAACLQLSGQELRVS